MEPVETGAAPGVRSLKDRIAHGVGYAAAVLAVLWMAATVIAFPIALFKYIFG